MDAAGLMPALRLKRASAGLTDVGVPNTSATGEGFEGGQALMRWTYEP